MLKVFAKSMISSRKVGLLLLLTLLAGIVSTWTEWVMLSAVFKMQGEYDIEPNTEPFRISLSFTLILFGVSLSVISPRLSKLALILMTSIFITYWVMFFERASELSLPFGSRDEFGFARNLTHVSYQVAPLIALVVGYVFWWKRFNYHSIGITGLLCVVFQFLMWFVDTRFWANSTGAGTDLQYPPITINATFMGVTWGQALILIFCMVTVIARLVSMKRDRHNEELRHL